MSLSVVIPCYNAASTIADQLEALADQQWSEPWEVIVSDNGSTDGSREIVERYKGRLPHLRIVDASGKRGVGHARNVGAWAARGDAVVFVDADDQVAPGWLPAIGEALSQHDLVASHFEADELNDPWQLEAHHITQRNGVQTFSYPPYLNHAGGCGLGIRRSLFEAVGGFDEEKYALEDTDLCFKAQLAGAELVFVPDAIIQIRYRENLSGAFRQAMVWGTRNVWIYKKYRPLGMPELSWKVGVHNWIRQFRRLLRIRTKRQWTRWLWQFGWLLGRVRGCIRYRVLAL